MALHFISEQRAYSFIAASPHLCPHPYRQHTQHALCICVSECVCVFFVRSLESMLVCLFRPEWNNLPML